MKQFNLDTIISLDLNVYNLQNYIWSTNIWGKQQIYNILGITKKNIVTLDLLPIFIDLRKIMYVTHNIAFNRGSYISCFLYNSYLYNNELKESLYLLDSVDNGFYYAFIDKWYGLISNFETFIKYKAEFFKKIKDITNYNRNMLPNIVFMSNSSWKLYDQFFFALYKCGVISIKSASFYQKDINVCYNLFVGNSYKIHSLIENIYKFYNMLRIKKW